MKRSRIELFAAILAACLAISSCKEDEAPDSTPDVSDPLPPWPVRGRPQFKHMEILEDGTVLVVVRLAT